MIQHQQIDAGGHQQVKSCGCWSVEVGGDVDVGIWASRPAGSAAVQIREHRPTATQRLDCLCGSLFEAVPLRHNVHRTKAGSYRIMAW